MSTLIDEELNSLLSELKRLKRAVDHIEEAKTSANTVIEASQGLTRRIKAVLDKDSPFLKQLENSGQQFQDIVKQSQMATTVVGALCSNIKSLLNDADFSSRLDSIIELVKAVKETTHEHAERYTAELNGVRQELRDLSNRIERLDGNLKVFASLDTKANEILGRQQKQVSSLADLRSLIVIGALILGVVIFVILMLVLIQKF